MPDSQSVNIKHIPSPGLNLEEDETNAQPQVLTQATNVFVDKRSIYTRKGIARTTYTAAAGDDILAAFKAQWKDGSEDTFIVDENSGTPGMYRWTGSAWSALTLPADITLTSAERGQFHQYRNSVYYTSASIDPLRIYKSGGTYVVCRAGTPSPDTILLLDMWEDTTSGVWTAPTNNGVAAASETNSTFYTMGDGGITLSDATASETTTYKWTPASPLSLEAYYTGYDVADTDMVCFYLHRHYRRSISSMTIRFHTSESAYYECLIGGKIDDTDETSIFRDFNPGGSIVKKWSNNFEDFQTFFVRLRKEWFTVTNSPDWGNITYLEIDIATSADAGSDYPARVTINYLHVRSSMPVPNMDGYYLRRFEGGETWSGSGVSRSYYHAYEGAQSLKLTLTNSSAVTATSASGLAINASTLNGGNELATRDKIVMYLAADYNGEIPVWLTDPPVKVTVTLIDGDSKTAAVHWWIGHGALKMVTGHTTGRYVKQVERFLASGPVTYGNGASSFGTFGWSNIDQITVSAQAGGNTNKTINVYVDALRIERGRYWKNIQTFTPGIIDYADAASTTDAVQNFLSDYPLISKGVEVVGDWLQHIKYRTYGTGYMQMPHYEHSEKGKASLASMKISAGPDGDNDPWGYVAGFNERVEGFRVYMPYHKKMFRLGETTLDLTKYRTWTYAEGNSADAEIQDNDKVRIWTWISDPSNLDRIKFRLYCTDQGEDADWNILDIKDDSSDATYFEYIWDASKLMTPEALEAKRAADIQDTYEKGSIQAAIDNHSKELATENVTGLPDGIEKLGGVILDKLGLKYDELDQFLGLDYGLFGRGLDDEDGINHVITWRRGDFVFKNGSDDSADWSKIIGASIEVIPKAGQTVEVCFDNWYIYQAGAMQGNYWWCTTFTDVQGQESKPGSPTEMLAVDGADVYINNLPATWPGGVELLNLYRMGGTTPEWRLVGKVGREGQTFYFDDKGDDSVGARLQEFADMPPKATVSAIMGERMVYGNITDRFAQQHPGRLYISDVFRPGRCPVPMIRDLDPNDGMSITGLASFQGYGIAFKERSSWTLDLDEFMPVKRSDKIGCIARKSIAVTEQFVLFLSQDGPATFNVAQATSQIGRPVRSLFDAVSLSNLSNAVGFIYDDYYHLFYGANMEDAVILHLPTMTWTQAKYKIAASKYAQVTDVIVDKADDLVFLATADQTDQTYAKSLLDFHTADDDCGQTITATIRWVDTDAGSGEYQKNPKAYYARARKLAGTPSYEITPYIDQSAATSGGAAYTHSSGNITGTGDETNVYINKLSTGSFLYGVQVVFTGRIAMSLLTSVLDLLPMRNR